MSVSYKALRSELIAISHYSTSKALHLQLELKYL